MITYLTTDSKDEPQAEAVPTQSWFRRANRFTISPENKTMKRYDSFMVAMGYLSGVVILYELAYQDKHPSVIALTYICDFFFIVEVLKQSLKYVVHLFLM